MSDGTSTSGKGGGDALQEWVDRLRQAQNVGLSKSGGERKKASIAERASHDTLNTQAPTDGTRTANACIVLPPALCAPILAITLATRVAAMATPGSSSAHAVAGSSPVAATPWADSAANPGTAGYRGRASSRDLRGGDERGRSSSRTRGGKGGRGALGPLISSHFLGKKDIHTTTW